MQAHVPVSAAPPRRVLRSRATCPSQLHHSVRQPTRLAAAAAEAPAAGEGVQQQQQPAVDFLGVLNDMQTARGILHTAADPDLVYGILTDYDSCPRMFRSVASSQTLHTQDGGKQVIQAGKWQFLLFSGTFNVCLNVVESTADRSVVFTLAESSFMKNFEGRWQIQPLPGGGSRAEYVLAVQPLLPIPAAVAPYTGGIFKAQVADLLADVQAELDRHAEAAGVA